MLKTLGDFYENGVVVFYVVGLEFGFFLCEREKDLVSNACYGKSSLRLS